MKYVLLALVICLSWQSMSAEKEAIFRSWDRNGDGFLVIEEVPPPMQKFFNSKDANGDGKVSMQEHLGLKRKPSLSNSSEKKAHETTNTKPTFRIRQIWHQETNGYDREVFVREPKKVNGKVPVVIYFHGNGGQASRSLGRFGYLDNILFLAPQGYERSWNIFGERSEAPDVAFFREILKRIPKYYPQADIQNLVLIGSSNGAGMINRIMIEMEEHPYRAVIQLVASLIEKQYHDGSFWVSSNSSNLYDIPKKPANPGPEILYFHGSEDKVVPYNGGLRSGKFAHVSAQDTAYAWAKAFGFKGARIPDAKGREVSDGFILYDYPDARVRHYKLSGSGHNTRPYGKLVDDLIRKTVLR